MLLARLARSNRVLVRRIAPRLSQAAVAQHQQRFRSTLSGLFNERRTTSDGKLWRWFSSGKVEEVEEVEDASAEDTATSDEEEAEPVEKEKEGVSRTKHTFQAETSQLLDIVSRSLYTDKEVFIRELISNASDALEKARHRIVTGDPVEDAEAELRIDITVDPEANTITIKDTGIGLSEDELHECLGTIAKSGTKAFMQAAAQDPSASGNSNIGESLIGQFGVGFYSAFMVADGVDVFSKSADPEQGPRLWSSAGKC